ncbi:12393_t:CDS:1 [Ambispora leptoticha]|uniref:12393_t:CDS:1 n=1 Tax=Ambispora leptoticha TaxID=144679 RepID=A0A9N9G8Z2_9GLOM|nr:12393_t:CDS:1 [Ambispora leptoticha]
MSSLSIFLTGSPRTGKTTLIKKIVNNLQRKYPPTKLFIQGFYTEEVVSPSSSSPRKRIGFDLITINSIETGSREILARKEKNWPPNYNIPQDAPRVGEYIVDTTHWPNLAISSITPGNESHQQNPSKRIIVIDEIGKMESFSDEFIHVAEQVIFGENDKRNYMYMYCVLGTVSLRDCSALDISIKRKAGFRLRNHEDDVNKPIRVIEVTRENRDLLESKVVKELESILCLN